MKTILIMSGGMDSTTLLYKLKAEGDEVLCLLFYYGQKHKKELDMAFKTCQITGTKHEFVEFPHTVQEWLKHSGSLTDSGKEIPEGHYADENMKDTVVPNRNMMMLSMAASIGIMWKADRICYGAHAGDHDIYPDCRQDFIEAISEAIKLCDWHKISLEAPFKAMTKAEIVSLGLKLGVPYKDTWSCYKGGEKACGKCGTCVERLEAFSLAGAEDPISYEDNSYWKNTK